MGKSGAMFRGAGMKLPANGTLQRTGLLLPSLAGYPATVLGIASVSRDPRGKLWPVSSLFHASPIGRGSYSPGIGSR